MISHSDLIEYAKAIVDDDTVPNTTTQYHDEHIRALKTVVIDLQREIKKMKQDMNNLKRRVRMRDAKF